MDTGNKKVVTRMAPSPTGAFHVGSVRTALYNYLFARQNSGKFILRIEDTDKERSKKEFEENIIKSFKWLGFDYDEFHRQSERTEIYKKYLQKLLADGKAYVANEEKGSVIRFKNPGAHVMFYDIILGEIHMDTNDLGDFVIAKDLETPLYNFSVVVDDYEMSITHVIRGQDVLSNTPRQILIQEALGFPRPEYAHLPLILAPDKSKLSKRHGALSTLEYREIGYLPEALLNFMALIGWNPGDEREIFTLKDLLKEFKLEKVQKSGGVFNVEKLNWINKEHIKKLPFDEQVKNIEKKIQTDLVEKVTPIIIERINKWSDIDEMIKSGELDWVLKEPNYDSKNLIWKQASKEAIKENLKTIKTLIEPLDTFDEETVKNAIWPYAEEKGRGEVLWPMRYALSGKDKSPDPFVLAGILGKEKSIERINKAILLL